MVTGGRTARGKSAPDKVSLERQATWPSAGANDWKGTAQEGQRRGQLDAMAEQSWRTPTAEASEEPGERRATDATINSQARGWKTPHGLSVIREGGGGEFANQETGWMTPSGLDVKAGAYTYDQHDKSKPRASLTGQSRSFPQDPPTLQDGSESSTPTPASPRRLNPRFVSYLMGWPLLGATTSDCSETAWSRYKQRMRSRYCGLVCE
jgi:hypothetical protein